MIIKSLPSLHARQAKTLRSKMSFSRITQVVWCHTQGRNATVLIPAVNAVFPQFKMCLTHVLCLNIRVHLSSGRLWVIAMTLKIHKALDSIRYGRDC